MHLYFHQRYLLYHPVPCDTKQFSYGRSCPTPTLVSVCLTTRGCNINHGLPSNLWEVIVAPTRHSVRSTFLPVDPATNEWNDKNWMRDIAKIFFSQNSCRITGKKTSCVLIWFFGSLAFASQQEMNKHRGLNPEVMMRKEVASSCQFARNGKKKRGAA